MLGPNSARAVRGVAGAIGRDESEGVVALTSKAERGPSAQAGWVAAVCDLAVMDGSAWGDAGTSPGVRVFGGFCGIIKCVSRCRRIDSSGP